MAKGKRGLFSGDVQSKPGSRAHDAKSSIGTLSQEHQKKKESIQQQTKVTYNFNQDKQEKPGGTKKSLAPDYKSTKLATPPKRTTPAASNTAPQPIHNTGAKASSTTTSNKPKNSSTNIQTASQQKEQAKKDIQRQSKLVLNHSSGGDKVIASKVSGLQTGNAKSGVKERNDNYITRPTANITVNRPKVAGKVSATPVAPVARNSTVQSSAHQKQVARSSIREQNKHESLFTSGEQKAPITRISGVQTGTVVSRSQGIHHEDAVYSIPATTLRISKQKEAAAAISQQVLLSADIYEKTANSSAEQDIVSPRQRAPIGTVTNTPPIYTQQEVVKATSGTNINTPLSKNKDHIQEIPKGAVQNTIPPTARQKSLKTTHRNNVNSTLSQSSNHISKTPVSVVEPRRYRLPVSSERIINAPRVGIVASKPVTHWDIKPDIQVNKKEDTWEPVKDFSQSRTGFGLTAAVTTGTGRQEQARSEFHRETKIEFRLKKRITNKPTHTSEVVTGAASTSWGKDIRHGIQNALKSQRNNTGAETMVTGIVFVTATAKGVNVAQKITGASAQQIKGLIPKATKIAKDTYRIGQQTYTLSRKVITGQAKLNVQSVKKLKTWAAGQLKGTKLATKIMQTKAAVSASARKTIYNLQRVKALTINTVRYTRNVIAGIQKVNITKEDLSRIQNRIVRFGKKSVRIVRKGTVKGVRSISTVGGKTKGFAGKSFSASGKTIRSVANSSDDTGLQAVSTGIDSSRVGYKAGKAIATRTVNGVRTGLRGTMRTGRGIQNFTRVARSSGLRVAFSQTQAKFIKAVQQAGGSVVSAAINLVRQLGMKVALPLLLVVCVVAGMMTITSTPVSAVASMFGGEVTTKDTGEDINVQEWLTIELTTLRTKFVNEIKKIRNDNHVSNGGEYHYIRFYNMYSADEVELTETNIINSIYSVQQYISMIEPVFQTIMLTEYDLEPTKAQMNSTLNTMWANLVKTVVQEEPMEYCYDATAPHACGHYHADTGTCPNYVHGYHDVHTCDDCCYTWYTCPGHPGDHDASCPTACYIHDHQGVHVPSCPPGCTSTHGHNDTCSVPCDDPHIWYHDTSYGCEEHFICNGYYYCEGHRILSIRVQVNGYDFIMNKYFNDEISQLESRSSLTAAQAERLEFLKDSVEFCEAYLENLHVESMNGETWDLSDIELTILTEYACQFVGSPYVFGGTNPSTGIDCSAFIQMVFRHVGVELPRNSWMQATLGTNVGSINSAQPGDLLFYSNNGTDAGVYHVGMYLGGGLMIHASNPAPYPNGGVKINAVYGPIHSIKRIAA